MLHLHAGVAGRRLTGPTDVMLDLQADELLSPFLEPLVRSFLLGMTAACALETGHVATQARS